MIIEENIIGVTKFDSEKAIIIENYKGRFSFDLILEHFEKIESFCLTNEVKASIVDLRKLYGSFIKLFDSLDKSYYPKMKKSGMKFQAIIMAEDLIIENLFLKVAQKAHNFGIEVAHFANREKADLWLTEKLQTLSK